MDPRILRSRFTGAIVGFGIGDALGMPTQFLSREQIQTYYGNPLATFTRAHNGHASQFLPQGSFTDDTQMMLVTAESLVECGRMDPAHQADSLLSWHLNPVPRTPMRANELACKHLAMGKPWNKSGVFSGGCGAAVRMPPIGLFYFRNTDTLVRSALENCLITHTDPRAKSAAVAVAYLTARLVRSSDHSSPGDQVLEVADRVQSIDADMAAMLRWVTQIVHLRPEEALFEIGTSSDSLEAVPAAIYCFLKHPRHFKSAVLIAVNAGDASDSIAALTGSFVGAIAGIGAIPIEWQQQVEDADVLSAIAEQLAALAIAEDAPQ
jgi:ADP-ribosylglycohydrolase